MCGFIGKKFLTRWVIAFVIGGGYGSVALESAAASEVVPLITADSLKVDSETEIVQTGLTDMLDPDKLLGLFVSTSDSYCDFISPMTNPVFFEDPRTLTEARAIFLHHEIPAALGGQNVDLIALQLRAAITERLSIIATKDGFIFSDSPLLSDGWADLAAGLKYQLISNEEIGAMLSSGFTFEMPIGTKQALQGNGNGEFNFFLTGGKRILDTHHIISTAGWRQPTDRAEESSVFYWSNHIDHQFLDRLYVFTEYNWYHWMSSGQGGVPGIEGGDLFNLGSTDVGGNNIVTGAFGVKYKPDQHCEIGLCYEWPFSKRQDLLENRITADLILRY